MGLKVESFMTKSVVTLPKTTKVSSAVKLMAERSMSCIVMVDKRDKPVGIITERDLVRRVLFANLNPKSTEIGRIMSSPIIAVTKETDIFTAIGKMRKNKIRRLVVVDSGGVLTGIVTQTDLFKAIIALGA